MAARSVTARHSHEVVSRLMLSEQWPTAVVSEHTATTSVVTLAAAVTQSTSTTIVCTYRPGLLASVLGSARHSAQYIGNETNALL